MSALKQRCRRPQLKIDLSCAKQVMQPPLVEQVYILHEVVGQGSLAVVRRATRRSSAQEGTEHAPQETVVKTIHTSDPERVHTAEKEHKFLMELHHPNIIRIFELIVDPAAHRIDIIMPLIPGERLYDLVKRSRLLAEDFARSLFTQLMRAVLHCHTCRVCHRDIKPENIMVSKEEDGNSHLVLLDFNCACYVGGLTPTGTPPYKAPEAWQEQHSYNEMTDVWSAGVCLYFMLSGVLPWIGERHHVLLAEVSRFPIRLPPGLTAEALNLLRGLLCRDVSVRLMVAGALAHPWCRLSSAEVWGLFGSSPDLLDSEIGAVSVDRLRRSSTKAATDFCPTQAELPSVNALRESMPQSSLRRSSSWPCAGSGSLDATKVAPGAEPASPQEFSLNGHEQHWHSRLLAGCRGSTCRASSTSQFEDWQRAEQFEDLYGQLDVTPHYKSVMCWSDDE